MLKCIQTPGYCGRCSEGRVADQDGVDLALPGELHDPRGLAQLALGHVDVQRQIGPRAPCVDRFHRADELVLAEILRPAAGIQARQAEVNRPRAGLQRRLQRGKIPGRGKQFQGLATVPSHFGFRARTTELISSERTFSSGSRKPTACRSSAISPKVNVPPRSVFTSMLIANRAPTTAACGRAP